MIKRAAAACFAAALCAGGAGAAEPAARIAVDGEQRRYLLHAPGDAAAPLIVALHADGQSARAMRRDMRLDAEADARDWAVVYPQGRLNTWASADDPEDLRGGRAAKVDDLVFLDALIADLEARGVAQEGQIFLAGYDRGAVMAHRYACERSDRIVGFAMVEAQLAEAPPCAPRVGAAVLIIKGVPTPGLVGYRLATRAVGPISSRWAARSGCRATGAPTGRDLAPEGFRASWIDTVGCPTIHRMITVGGGGRYWPGSAEPERRATHGVRPIGLNAAEEIAKVFAASL